MLEQVTAHVGEEERKTFDRYAEKFGLDAGNLLHILWLRELRLGRLASAGQDRASPDQGSSGANLDSKVTMHNTPSDVKKTIKSHCSALGLSVSRAGATLLRDEMEENWLQGRIGDDSD